MRRWLTTSGQYKTCPSKHAALPPRLSLSPVVITTDCHPDCRKDLDPEGTRRRNEANAAREESMEEGEILEEGDSSDFVNVFAIFRSDMSTWQGRQRVLDDMAQSLMVGSLLRSGNVELMSSFSMIRDR